MSDPGRHATATPYRGIHPFRFVDQAFYFGREELIEELLTKIILYRLVVLFGESGVGKSSLLNAGIIAALKRKGYQPEKLRVQPFKDRPLLVERIDSGGDGDNAFLPSIFFDARDKVDGPAAQSRTLSLTEFRSKLDEAVGEVYPVLIFDQFEELFTLFKQTTGHDIQSQLIKTVIDIVADTTLKAKIVIAIREDFLAKLNVIAKEYPQVFDHRVHVRLLDKKNALDAILNPFDDPNPFRSRLSGELAATIVEQLSGQEPDGSIQPTQLQVICSRLWEKYAAVKPEIGSAEFKEMGEVKGILKGFLTSELARMAPAQREPAVMLLENLITESGTRDVVSKKRLAQSLAEHKDFRESELDAILSNLQKRRLINEVSERGTFYYDLASEFLVEPIQKERERYLLERARRSQQDRYQWFVAALIVLLAIGSVFFTNRLREKARAAEAAEAELSNAEKELIKKSEEVESERDAQVLFANALAEIESGDEQKKDAARDRIVDMISDRAIPENFVPLAEAIVRQYQPNKAGEFTRALKIAINTPTNANTSGNQDSEKLKPRIYIRFNDDSQKDKAYSAAAKLRAADYLVPKLQRVKSGPHRNELRYYREDEEALARQIKDVLESSGVEEVGIEHVQGYENSTMIRPKHFELWFEAVAKPAIETTTKPACQDCTALITDVKGEVILALFDQPFRKARKGDAIGDGDSLEFYSPARVTISCSNGISHTISERGDKIGGIIYGIRVIGPWCPEK
ncbi:MAG TPA: ATP-binding protein [Blastocatellia bacterium]|nr:ATP-binding protein [Blastocatellia bacterium]